MAIPFPILTTERLNLRKITLSDAERIHFFRSDKQINQFIQRAQPQTLEMTRAHIEKISGQFKKNQSIVWGIALQDSKTLIGSICLWNFSEDKKIAEVGYDLDPEFQGQGFMSEALKAVIDFGFVQKGFETIEAYTDFKNITSKNLLKRHGFIPSANKQDPDNQNNEVYHLNL